MTHSEAFPFFHSSHPLLPISSPDQPLKLLVLVRTTSQVYYLVPQIPTRLFDLEAWTVWLAKKRVDPMPWYLFRRKFKALPWQKSPDVADRVLQLSMLQVILAWSYHVQLHFLFHHLGELSDSLVSTISLARCSSYDSWPVLLWERRRASCVFSGNVYWLSIHLMVYQYPSSRCTLSDLLVSTH
jgi:hypothetical protein